MWILSMQKLKFNGCTKPAAAALLALVLLLAAPLAVAGQSATTTSTERWSAQQAWKWYDAHPWLVGSNYIPSNAINQLQMWQAATFDPSRINVELGWAQKLGMNTMRVFLHNLLWAQDPKGFVHRINIFLNIAAKHHIKPIFVLFDSVWDPDPKLGPQHPPIPGVHNSGWVQAPGTAMLENSTDYPQLEAYVKGVVRAFANDKRVLAWDVWNEPDNPGGGDYQAEEPRDKFQLVASLLPKVFAWVRSEHPVQPLISGLWHGPSWAKSDESKLNAIERTQLNDSDVLTFHNYGFPEQFRARVEQLRTYGRPIICTEYMARGEDSLIDNVLPLGKYLDVGMINWGFVTGKTQTKYPWNSWQRPYVNMKPMVWFHDLLHQNGKPYREREAIIIRSLSESPRGVVPLVALIPGAEGPAIKAPQKNDNGQASNDHSKPAQMPL